jgi:uncharacterized protein (TIGR02246 family)
MIRPRHLALLLVALAAAWVAYGARATPIVPLADAVEIRREVMRTLAHGAAAWNKGNLEDFVSDYLDDSGTTYVGKRGLLHGMPAIRDAFADRFAPGAPRDSLHFEAVEVDILAPDVVNTVALHVLMRGDSVTSRGPTSLVMRRVAGRWRIVHDHSS